MNKIIKVSVCLKLEKTGVSLSLLCSFYTGADAGILKTGGG